MSALPPARSPSLEENAAKPQLAEGTSDPAEFLGLPASESMTSLPASESMTSTGSQYHSALNSPISCETLDPPTVEEQLQGRDLISFSSGNLSGLVTLSKALTSPTSSSFVFPPKSPEFSSNHYKFQSPCKPQLDADIKESGKTPNVYINGLPPNFREDQLRAIAAPFGEVLSVRCFTRQTLKSPSGYGFVLFKTLAAAEKCILTLRRSDLHPSFSKVNKPLRVVHSPNSPILELPAPSSLSSLGSSDSESALPGSPELDFKAKMAQLEDKNSPNVYIEGLPMSADKNTLMELVYPYAIQSTRFLRSKLPQSQTMIAFMRMESRAAAENVILRLNGKNVRGWDGNESRVYLRIADTLDQRELRRSEASNREDDPGRLTIAQATLLNYRAKDLQSPSLPPIYAAVQNKRAEPRLPDPMAATVHDLLTGNPEAGLRRPLPANQFIPDTLPHPLAANIHDLLAANAAQNFGPTAFPQDPLYAPYACPPPPPLPANMHPNVAALFESLAAMQQRVPPPPVYPPVMAMFPNHFNTNVNVKPPVPSVQNHNPNIMQAAFHQSTPAENFVMQARAEMEMQTRAKLQSLGINPMPNVRPAAAPGLVNGNVNPRLVNYQRPQAVPPQFFSPAVTAAPKLPTRSVPAARSNQSQTLPQSYTRSMPPPQFNPPPKPAPPHMRSVPLRQSNPPPPRPAQPHTAPPPRAAHHPSPTLAFTTRMPPPPNEILKPMNGSGLARQPSFTSAHARASTAPVAPRQHSSVPPVRRERNNTNMNTNRNSMNMNTNMNMKQDQNLFASPNPGHSAPEIKSPPPASTRVFLGPQNIVHLPLLRFT